MKITGLWPPAGIMVLLAGFAPAAAYPQDDAIYIDISGCIRIQSAIGRFACYEDLANQALTSGNAGELPPGQASATPSQPQHPTQPQQNAQAAHPDTPAPAAQTAVTDDDYGLQVNKGKFDRKKELHGTIAGLRELVPNQWLITLTNGQVWRQMRSKRYRLREGYAVRIYPTRWGQAYRLAVDDLGGYIQVERVK